MMIVSALKRAIFEDFLSIASRLPPFPPCPDARWASQQSDGDHAGVVRLSREAAQIQEKSPERP
ncbi:MAG TPA: hypothetical protein VIU82_07775 [Bosea sp. (in: a-proteobacteria)]